MSLVIIFRRGYTTICVPISCANSREQFEMTTLRYNTLFDHRLLCCGEDPQQYPTYNDSDSYYEVYVDSDYTEEFYNDSAEEFHSDYAKDVDKDFIDLTNDFAKHFDRHSAVGVKSTLVSTRMGEFTNQGNDMFHNSNGPSNVLLMPGWKWSGSSRYIQSVLMVMGLTQPLAAKS